RPPTSPAAWRTPSASTSEQTTCAPSAASARAQARPMPPAAPVTSAVLRLRPVSTLAFARPGAHELHDLDGVSVRVARVHALAAAVRSARRRHRGVRAETDALRAQPLDLGVEVVCQQADVRAAHVLEGARAARRAAAGTRAARCCA